MIAPDGQTGTQNHLDCPFTACAALLDFCLALVLSLPCPFLCNLALVLAEMGRKTDATEPQKWKGP